jgi:virulence-associated protein VagC
MEDAEESVVFKNGNSVAVRLVGKCRLPKGTKLREYRRGNRIILEPIGGWPRSFVASLGAFPQEIPRPEDEEPRNPFG